MFRNLRDILGDADAQLGDDDILGWDELGYRRARHPQHHAAHPHASHAMARRPPPAHLKAAAEVSSMLDVSPGTPEALVEPLGFTVAAFAFGGATTIKVEAKPQRRMKGTRLFIEPVKTGAAGTLIMISSIRCGGRELLPSDDPVLVSPFANNAVGGGLAWTVQGQGSIISVTYTLAGAALVAGDTITIGTQLNYLTVGASDA